MTPLDSTLEHHDADDSGDVFLNMAREEPESQPTSVSNCAQPPSLLGAFLLCMIGIVIASRLELLFPFFPDLRASGFPLDWLCAGADTSEARRR